MGNRSKERKIEGHQDWGHMDILEKGSEDFKILQDKEGLDKFREFH